MTAATPVPADNAPLGGFIVGFCMSVDTGSVALRTADGQVFEQILQGHASHAADALSGVQSLMQQAGVSPAQCLAVAADVGPGGFTGLRTACGLAQGLAVGWQVPTVAVSSLNLLAHAAISLLADPPEGLYLAALDARQSEVYVAAFQWCGGQVKSVLAPSLCPYGGFPVTDLPVRVAVGPGVRHLAVPPSAVAVVLDPDLLPRAAVLVQVAALQAAAGLFLQPAQCQPLYVREQVALTTEQRRQQVRG